MGLMSLGSSLAWFWKFRLRPTLSEVKWDNSVLSSKDKRIEVCVRKRLKVLWTEGFHFADFIFWKTALFFYKYTIGFAKFQNTKSFNIQMIDFFPTANYGFACNFFPWLPKNLINLLIGTIEFYEFPNSQVQLYASRRICQFFALTGFVFSHIMLAWPFYDLPCSTFFQTFFSIWENPENDHFLW